MAFPVWPRYLHCSVTKTGPKTGAKASCLQQYPGPAHQTAMVRLQSVGEGNAPAKRSCTEDLTRESLSYPPLGRQMQDQGKKLFIKIPTGFQLNGRIYTAPLSGHGP